MRDKVPKSWEVGDVYDIKSIDGGAFYLDLKYTCKYCGYTFHSGNTCGSFFNGQERPDDIADKKAVEHIINYHINKKLGALR